MRKKVYPNDSYWKRQIEKARKQLARSAQDMEDGKTNSHKDSQPKLRPKPR